MKRILTAAIATTLALVSPTPPLAQQPSGGDITVRLYNFAAMPDDVVSRARQEADSIFNRSGVTLTWLDCTLDAERLPAEPACFSVRGNRVLNIRLMPKHMEPSNGLAGGIFGLAMLSKELEFATIANIYVERLNAIADGRKYREGVVLGAMIAHEMGHLLLGVGSHSKMGLMTLPWGPKVLTAADQGTLSFSKRENRKLAKAVRERNPLQVAVTRAR
jgi:hypothetical protein